MGTPKIEIKKPTTVCIQYTTQLQNPIHESGTVDDGFLWFDDLLFPKIYIFGLVTG